MPLFAKIGAKSLTKKEDHLTAAVGRDSTGAVFCPDGRSQCPSGNTCCKMISGGYGCCPLPMALCCNDGVHCCPNGYTCNVGAGTCSKGKSSMPFYAKVAAVQESSAINLLKKDAVNKITGLFDAVICPDGESECPDGNTCCALSSGQFGCCPLPEAVCCTDEIHCCPNGYNCDVSAGTCNKGIETLAWFAKITAKPVTKKVDHLSAAVGRYSTEAVVCPDGESQCPSGNTCCKLSSGSYGCCPLPKATCCNDGVHCCPNGYTCNVGAGKCDKGYGSMPFFSKVAAVQRSSTINFLKKDATNPISGLVDAVICPDGESECPDGNTCCALSSGQFGCCPLPEAVCCTDEIHCCPNGYTCDVSAGSCNRQGSTLAWLGTTVHASRGLEQASNKADLVGLDILCPDSQSSCPDTTTCCLMSDGAYGCCPIKKAVCCKDHLHCCPENYTCDVERESCVSNAKRLPWLRHSRAKQASRSEGRSESVPCPGGGFCPDENTCCSMGGGRSGCCPYDNATCCSDLLHCCPEGTRCLQEGTGLICEPEQKMSPIELVKKFIESPTEAKFSEPVLLVRQPVVTSVICPDGSSWCNDGETCCVLSDGQYGCCPYTQGICCGDHLHCCPSGYNCSTSTCDQLFGRRLSLPLVKPRPANKMAMAVASTVPLKRGAGIIRGTVTAIDCGHGVSCPEGTTCCDMITGEPGCCPVPNAICCTDKLHCCAHDLECDETGTKCVSRDGSVVTDALNKLPANKN